MGARSRGSLVTRVVTLVALALFVIEIFCLVPFTYLYWERLLGLRREALEQSANAARPHVREALLRERAHERFETSAPPVFEGGFECYVFTPSGEYQLTVNHELAPSPLAPSRTLVLGAFEPGARPVFFEQGGSLIHVVPIQLEATPREGRADAVLYVQASLVDLKREFVTYAIFSFLVGAATLLVMGTYTVYHLRQRFLLPLARIIAADNAARRGDNDGSLIRPENIPTDELGAIMQSRNALLGRMTAVQRSLDEKNAELEAQRAELAAWGRELERLVKEKTAELVAARESLFLTEKLAALGRLAANVAHEINNPLASIAGYAEEVRERLQEIAGMPPDLPEGLRVIEDQAFRCKEILKRLLGLARADRFRVEPVDLGQLTRDTVRLCEPVARKKGIALEVRAKEGITVLSDAASIQQVILNLVENAVDAASAGKASRGEASGRVVVSLAARSEGGADGVRDVVLRVADDGFGVPEAIRDRVFDPFYTTKPVGRGTGLGLAICQSIVERLGGRIEIESVEGEGATFVVVLPVEPPRGADRATPATSTDETSVEEEDEARATSDDVALPRGAVSLTIHEADPDHRGPPLDA
jgi:signal transduction histidine kinase